MNSPFVNKDNLELLWEVLLDELHINKTNTNVISNVKTIFESNINLFISRTNPKTNILEQNKQFLNQVLLAVNQLLPQQNIKRINITDEEVLEPYKIEDIQAARQTDFEKDLERKRMELENYMTPTKPKELDFSDRNLSPLLDIDSLLADKMAERNLDFEQIYNKSNINPEQWLTPKKTSVNSEKIEETKHLANNINNKNYYNEVKNKKVSFDTSTTNLLKVEEDSSPINIFQKLKKTNVENDSNFPVEQKYQLQNSIPLPKQEEVFKNDPTPSPQVNQNIQQNVPIIPNSEIIKQLNEMNSKIDKLYEMMFKLTNKLEEIIEKNIDEDY